MQSARKRHALELFAGLPKRYHAMGALLSFGQDPRWRRMVVDAIAPRPGLRVADVATGTGLVALALAARGCEVVALDQSEAMLGEARAARRAASGARSEAALRPRRGRAAAVRRRRVRRAQLHLPAALRGRPRRNAARARARCQARRADRDARVRASRARHCRALRGTPTHASACPRSAGSSRPAWFEVGRFLGPSIEDFDAREA